MAASISERIFCRVRLGLCALLLAALGVLPGCGTGKDVPRPHGAGLFSWNASVLQREERQELISLMDDMGLTELYQYIPSDVEEAAVIRFAGELTEHGIRLFLLTGEPEWAMDRSGKAIIREIDRAAEIPGCAGVMADVEPYLLEEWDEDRQTVMECYAAAMTCARKSAEEAELELIACIPYYLDGEQTVKQLEKLIDDGCHTLAVMNYYRKHEAEHIETEMELCKSAGRALIHIYELLPAGQHGLEPVNTYAGEGLGALGESWEKLCAVYGEGPITYALHDLDALREMINSE